MCSPFLKISSDKTEQYFQEIINFLKVEKCIPNVFDQNLPEFPFHLIFILEFPQFSIEWFLHGIFWKLFQEISLLFAPILKFPEGLVEWRTPLQHTMIATF